MKSTIRLFKALPIKDKSQKTDEDLLKKTIKKGFLFTPEVVANYSNYDELIELVEKEIGISADQANNSFHKSWKKVKDADIEQLVLKQMIHYMTTYGFEKMGIYDKDSVFIPNEDLEIPELKDDIKLVVIKGYTNEELKKKLLTFLDSGIALGEDTIKDVLDLATYLKLQQEEIENIKNREVKVALFDYLNLVPKDPVEFLRLAIYRATGKTLVIKSPEVIKQIKENVGMNINGLFNKYKSNFSIDNLAGVFYRFKPLFLAFRQNQEMKTMINKIRKLAVKYHKPFKADFLNDITPKLSKGGEIDVDRLRKELGKVNIFRKIRLAYALKFRTKDIESVLYRVRNGKSYAKEFKFTNQLKAQEILDITLASIVEDISANVKGKKIYLPDSIHYTLPATEKQFTGYFPSGTYVSTPDNMIFGIHWNNVKRHRIDLDLSLIKSDGEKIGWDADYRTDRRDILFSGDITDAGGKKGASELFYLEKKSKDAGIMYVNYFNFEPDVEVPFKILVAHEKAEEFGQNYTVDPNNILAIANTKIDSQQKVLGLLTSSPTENRFYFAESSMGSSITSYGSPTGDHSREYLIGFYENSIQLRDLLEKAGATIIGDKEEVEDIDIDLSPENLEKDTIINLINPSVDNDN